MNYEKLPEWRLWVRALLPSPASLVGSFALAVGLIGFHLTLLFNDPNLLVPRLAGRVPDDQLVELYNSAIREPLDQAFGNSTLGVLSTALLWGLVGLVLYTAADFVFNAVSDWRRSNKDISVPLKNQVIQHPLHRQLIVRLLWRFMVGMLLIVFTLAAQPVITDLFRLDVDFLKSSSAVEMLKCAVFAIVGWLAVFHIYIVLFRLFVLKTRVFGEIIY